jgi:hypothetical protein
MSLQERQLGKIFDAALAGSKNFTAELSALLEKYQFQPSFIAALVPDLLEAYLNEDEVPFWTRPGYQAPEE